MAKKKKEIRREAGVCPKCGEQNLSYETILQVSEEGVCYPYICNDCEFEGNEWYSIEFSEHRTKEGEEV